MASHRLKPLYANKECSSCGSLYTRECCSIGSLENKILVHEPESSPCCAKCGTPVDGPYCRGCALLQKKFEEDLLTYCVENGIYQDFQDTFESSDDNTNIINVLREPIVVNQDPGEKSSQGPPLINQNFRVILAHIAPIPSGIVEADFDQNDDTSSDDDSFENIEIDPTISEASRVRYGYIKNHMKTVKNGQTRTRETEEHKRSQGLKAKAKKSQPLVNSHVASYLASYWLNPLSKDHGLEKKYIRKLKIALDLLSEKAQGVTITDCHAGNPCVHICDPTAKSNAPIIEGIQGM
ncbi:hypothetical protein Tco_0892739 [Tanacetum coccineum]|uniref:Uncharacterized protein n=1 Tax=Tanacetum coccineum TaxID=301880 RepID=A0ABQ5C9I5_9ASTR